MNFELLEEIGDEITKFFNFEPLKIWTLSRRKS